MVPPSIGLGKRGSSASYQLELGKREGSTGSWCALVNRYVTNQDDTADEHLILPWRYGTLMPNQRSSRIYLNMIKFEHRVTLTQERTEHFPENLMKSLLFHCSAPVSPTALHQNRILMHQCQRWYQKLVRARSSPKVPTR